MSRIQLKLVAYGGYPIYAIKQKINKDMLLSRDIIATTESVCFLLCLQLGSVHVTPV